MSIHKAGSLGLSTIGINDELSVHRNLNVDSLVRDITSNGEGLIASSGAAICLLYTSPSPRD